MRKLATIQKIEEILPIKKADRIEVAKVLGWQCVVPKGIFKPGDLCLYVEIDSILPDTELFKDFIKHSVKVKTRKFRGQISQGLVLTLDSLKGLDLSKSLGISKREEQVSTKNFDYTLMRPYPYFLPSTSLERIQSNPSLLYNTEAFLVTEKLDGCSATYYMKDGKFGVCSRKREWLDKSTVWWWVAEKYKLEKVLSSFDSNVAIQGEIIAPGIQKNRYARTEPEFYLYNIFNIDKQEKVDNINLVNTADLIELKTVPIIEIISLDILTIEDLVKMAKGKSKINKRQNREGLVFRSDNSAFKVICPYYLLKE